MTHVFDQAVKSHRRANLVSSMSSADVLGVNLVPYTA